MARDAGCASVVVLLVIMALQACLPPSNEPLVWLVAKNAIGLGVRWHHVQALGIMALAATDLGGLQLRSLVT